MFCSKCGANNPEGAAFCASCGAPMPVQQPAAVQQQPDYSQQQFTQPDYTAQQQYVQPTYIQNGPVQFPEMQQPKKKSKKKGIIIGAACGGAAVITAGALTLSLAQTSIMRSVMGDVEYAKSVNTRFLSSTYSQYSNIAKSAAKSSSNLLAPAKNAAGKSKLLSGSGFSANALSEYAGDFLDDIGDYSFDKYNVQEDSDIYDKYDSTTVQAASAVYMLADMLDSFSKDGITVSMGLKAELGEKLKKLVPEEYNAIIDDVMDVLATSELSVSAAKKDGKLSYSLYLIRNGGNFIGAVIQLTAEGDLTIAFPEATPRAVGFKIPSAAELGLDEALNNDSEPLLSEKDIEKLVDEITKAYLSCYDQADISYNDGSIDIDGNDTKCTVITTTFDSADIGMMIGKFADVIAQDPSVSKIMDKLGDEVSKDDIVDGLRELADEAKNSDPELGVKLISESYVNSANQPLGVKFTLGNYQNNFTFISIDTDSYARAAFEADGRTFVELVDRKSGSSSGKAVLAFYPDAMNKYGTYDTNDPNDSRIAIVIDYKDRKTFKAFGQETLGGTYTVSLEDSEMLREMLSRSSNSGLDVYEIVKGLSLTFSVNDYKNGIEESVGFAVDDYGSLTVTARVVPEANIPALPAGMVLISQDSEDADEEMQALGNDILSYLKDKYKSDPQLSKLDEDFEKIAGQKLSSIFDSSMTDYTQKSRITSANSVAASIKNSIDTMLTNADTQGYGMKYDESHAVITGIVDKTGRWELMLSDMAGFREGGGMKWENNASAYPSSSKSGVTNATEILAIDLANMFPDLRDCCFEAKIEKGRCTAVWFTPGTDSPYNVTDLCNGAQFGEGGWAMEYGYFAYTWPSGIAGISRDGYIIGTAPILPLG